MTFRLLKIDDRPIPDAKQEVRCFTCLKNEVSRLQYFLEYYRTIGVDRFFFIDNGSDDGTVEFLLDQPDCHVFDCDGSYFQENVSPPLWHNAILNTFGNEHWTLTVDADELLVYPHSETVPIDALAKFLDRSGADALLTPLIDMYPKGPLLAQEYEPGAPFLSVCDHFDAELPTERSTAHLVPAIQLIGGVRGRLFWGYGTEDSLPPCLTKVSFVRWKRGRRYIASMHLISDAAFSGLQGALLHFKFLPGFLASGAVQADLNDDINEKGLSEKIRYIKAFRDDPNLSFTYDGSVRYKDTSQLTKVGLIRTTDEFEKDFNSGVVRN